MSDEEDEGLAGIFENGHWEWNDLVESLVFESDFPEVEEDLSPPTPTLIGSIEFKEDVDLLEQLRFKKRFQRKPTENDIVQLQDIKDVVLFTAPKAILTPAIINVLHLPITERFIRALILYCQYFIQVSDEMASRIIEENTKVRTPKSEQVELEFRDNLEDLRLLIAKEYSCIIMGGGEVAKYHHMGLSKKMRSLSKRDSVLFETLLRISIQIVWLALGRKSYNLIELEIHRLFKSEMYNIIEHKLKTKYETQLSKRELFVLFGHCVHRNRMINAYSPLNNEMRCNRDIDYRMIGLGSVKYPKLSYRLRYLESALIEPEEKFAKMNMTLGILGLPRERFDTMLKEIKVGINTTSSSSFRQSVGRLSVSKSSRVSTTLTKTTFKTKLYEDIYIPDKYAEDEHIPGRFPTKMLPKKHCNEEQRKKWLSYVTFFGSKKKLNKKVGK